MKILLLEDEPRLRERLELNLRGHGLEVHAFPFERQAPQGVVNQIWGWFIGLGLADQPIGAVLDLRLGECTAFEVVESWRQQGLCPTPLYLASGGGAEALPAWDRQRAEQLGFRVVPKGAYRDWIPELAQCQRVS